MVQLRQEASQEADPAAALKEIESEADDYRAHRRAPRAPRPAAVARSARPTGSRSARQEMNRLIGQAASQYPPKDRDRFIQYVQNEPMAAAQLRAPLYEDKVVDFLFTKAEVTERAVDPRRARSRPRERGRPCPRAGLRSRPCRAGQAGQGQEGRSGQGREGRSGQAGQGQGRGAKAGQAEAGQAGQGRRRWQAARGQGQGSGREGQERRRSGQEAGREKAGCEEKVTRARAAAARGGA